MLQCSSHAESHALTPSTKWSPTPQSTDRLPQESSEHTWAYTHKRARTHKHTHTSTHTFTRRAHTHTCAHSHTRANKHTHVTHACTSRTQMPTRKPEHDHSSISEFRSTTWMKALHVRAQGLEAGRNMTGDDNMHVPTNIPAECTGAIANHNLRFSEKAATVCTISFTNQEGHVTATDTTLTLSLTLTRHWH